MRTKLNHWLWGSMGVLALCTGSMQAPPENPFGNALVPDMIADASIQVIDGMFYCYATTDGYGRGLETSGPPVVWKSPDFVNWSFNGTYFPSASTEKYWAPSKVVPANGRYYIYPTINGYMYPAVADSPDGPFKLARGEDRFYKLIRQRQAEDSIRRQEFFRKDKSRGNAYDVEKQIRRMREERN